MKVVKSVLLVLLTVFAGSISTGVFAVPTFPVEDSIVSIQKNPTTLGTTAVADPYGMTTGLLVNSIMYGGGTINLSDLNGNPLLTANPASPSDWWHGSGVVYTTTTNTINISFTDLLVTAFTFKLGANQSASGWIRAYYETDTSPSTLLTGPGNFSINNTVTDTYGVYVKEPTSSCAVITRIEIDPSFVWGVGDFGITTGGCAEVPEPGPIGLFMLGLMFIGLMSYSQRRKRQSQRI